jgi:hypothetical protein
MFQKNHNAIAFPVVQPVQEMEEALRSLPSPSSSSKCWRRTELTREERYYQPFNIQLQLPSSSRFFDLRFEQRPMTLDPFSCGSTIWDASIVLAKHLEHKSSSSSSDFLSNKSVLELGSGLGLVSCFAAALGKSFFFFFFFYFFFFFLLPTSLLGASRVISTGYARSYVLEHLLHNIQTNLPSEVFSKVSVEGLRWYLISCSLSPSSSLPFSFSDSSQGGFFRYSTTSSTSKKRV